MEVEVPKIKKDENQRLKMILPPSHIKCPLRLCTFLKKIFECANFYEEINIIYLSAQESNSFQQSKFE